MTDTISDTNSAPEGNIGTADDLDTFTADLFSAEQADVKENPEDSEPSHEADTDTDPEVDVDPVEDDGDEEPEGDPEPEQPKGKKKSRFQERIDDLTAKLRDGDRIREAQSADLAKALAKLEELSAGKPADETQNTQKPRGLVEPTADDLLEDGSPKYPLGEFDPKLLRDLTRYDRAVERAHEAEVAAAEKAEQAEVEKFNALQAGWNDKVATAKETYPDYVQKGEALLYELSDIPQEHAVYLTHQLMDMEYGPDVFYYLAEHPDEARAIANSSPEKALNRLGRIEARFEIAALEQSGKETKLRTTKAPEPAPRNRGSNAAAPSIDPESASLDDFERELFPNRRR